MGEGIQEEGAHRWRRPRIVEDGRLSEEQMKKMVDEAEQHAEEDKKKAAQIEGRNRLEYYLYSVSNSLKENEDKIKDSIEDNFDDNFYLI